MNRDAFSLERNQPDQVGEECLAGTILADHEPNRGSSVGDPIDVAQQRGDLRGSAYLYVRQTDTGHDAGTQCLDDRVPLLRLDRLGWFRHAVVSLSSASRPRRCGTITISSPSSSSGSSKWSKDQSLIRSSAPSESNFISRAR